MAVRKWRANGRLDTAKAALTAGLLGAGQAVELIDTTDYAFEPHPFAVQVYEKFYQRVSNRLTLTVTYCQTSEAEVEIIAASSAGAVNSFFRLTWGTEHNLINLVADVAGACGFISQSDKHGQRD